MMSASDSQAPMWSYQVNPDKRVREDHPLRRINKSGVRLEFCAEPGGTHLRSEGQQSAPPEVILRMMLLLFLDDIKSERELMRIIPGLTQRGVPRGA